MIIKAASFHSHNGLSIVQFVSSPVDTLEYIGLAEALQRNAFEVKELGQGGNVNLLSVTNRSPHFVFLMDGDILAGAKQNRVVNTSALVPPRSHIKLPVSCVERGRWRTTTDAFTGTDYTAPMMLRRMKSERVHANLMRDAGAQADQGMVWNAVDAYQRKHKVESETSNLSDVYERKRERQKDILELLPAHEGANGMAVFFGTTLAGIDLFDRIDVYKEYHAKLVRSAWLEYEVQRRQKPLAEAEARFTAEEFVDEALKAPKKAFESVGAGIEFRAEHRNSSILQLEYDHHLIHLSVMRLS